MYLEEEQEQGLHVQQQAFMKLLKEKKTSYHLITAWWSNGNTSALCYYYFLLLSSAAALLFLAPLRLPAAACNDTRKLEHLHLRRCVCFPPRALTLIAPALFSDTHTHTHGP